MLILLLLFFVVIAIALPFFYREREVVAIMGLLLRLVMTVGAVIIYIAKKGGIEDEFIVFFFINKGVRDSLRYLPWTLNQLVFLLAVGRCLFPYYLLKVAVSYSLSPFARSIMPKFKWFFLINVSTLVLSSPYIYTYLIAVPTIMELVIGSVNFILITMILIALCVIYKEFFSIELAVFHRQFLHSTLLVTSVTGLYLLYFVQEPGQIYYFYLSNYVWQQGGFYLQALLPIRLYYVLVLATIVVSIFGAIGFIRYVKRVVLVTRQEVEIKKKTKLITPTTLMFIHGMQNQLLSHQILTKRLKKAWLEEAEPKEIERYLTALETDIADSLNRINRFYKSLSVNTSYLVPVMASEVLERSVMMFHQQYPHQSVEITCPEETCLLAYKELLSEA